MERYIKPAVIVATAILLAIAFGYIVYLSVTLIRTGDVARIGLAVGLILLCGLGAWSTWQIMRNGLELQRISQIAAEDGCEIDMEGIERRPSGRLTPEASSKLFDEIAAEYEADPENWRTNYRLARAYDYAGDRGRARDYMREAVRRQGDEARGAGGERTEIS